MKKKYIFYVAFIVLLATYIYYHRNTYISHYDWKQTSNNGTIGSGFISFDSNYIYQWPVIKYKGNSVGIVLLCINQRMVVYSLQDKNIGFYMYI